MGRAGMGSWIDSHGEGTCRPSTKHKREIIAHASAIWSTRLGYMGYPREKHACCLYISSDRCAIISYNSYIQHSITFVCLIACGTVRSRLGQRTPATFSNILTLLPLAEVVATAAGACSCRPILGLASLPAQTFQHSLACCAIPAQHEKRDGCCSVPA